MFRSSAEQSAHRFPQGVDVERLAQHGDLRGPEEVLVRAGIGVARDEQERRPAAERATCSSFCNPPSPFCCTFGIT